MPAPPSSQLLYECLARGSASPALFPKQQSDTPLQHCMRAEPREPLMATDINQIAVPFKRAGGKYID